MESTDKLKELERLLGEARQRAEEAEREKQEEQRRAERAQQRAERAQQQAERAQQRAQAFEQLNQPTTLVEYIAACHDVVFTKFNIETDHRLTSRGLITNPRNKLCPTDIRPWPDFLQLQRLAFGALYEIWPAEKRVFESRSFLIGLGNRVSKRAVADERTLEYFLHNSVEDPVRSIIDQLGEVEEVRKAFSIGGGIVFENHPHAISDIAEEVVNRERPSTPLQQQNFRQLRPDQICVYQSDNSKSTARAMIFVSEYKPPHKLTAPHLRIGLRPMNIYKEVVNRKTIPTNADPDGRFQYYAERLTASAITQTYHYMVEGGLEYGLLTTGETIVFLKIDWSDPGVLYYHLAEPGPEVSAHSEHPQLCTAVGQYLAFTLMALGWPGRREEHGQDERERAMKNLKVWAEDFETTVRSIPESERSATSDSSPTTYAGVDRSPCFRRKRRRLEEDLPSKHLGKDDRSESSDDERSSWLPDSPTPTSQSTRQGTRRSQRLAQRSPPGDRGNELTEEETLPLTSISAVSEKYCTQACLIGLVRDGHLDPKCPNVSLHRKTGGQSQAHHPLRHEEWLQLLRKQLEHSLDNGITRLRNCGARGVLFRVNMLAYGYVFVSKGTVRAFVRDLEHEAIVYKRLQSIQGKHVPVFLGNIDLHSLNKTYFYDHRVYVVYLAFLSWAGCSITEAEKSGVTKQLLQKEAIKSLHAVHQEGVIHKDIRIFNMLYNTEIKGVMMIDFERAGLGPPPLLLERVVPNKRTWQERRTGRLGAVGWKRANREFLEEICEVEMVFM